MRVFFISISRIFLGLLIIFITYSILVFGLFERVLYQPILLIWVHIFSFSVGFYLAGLVNRKTNPMYLPLLYITLSIAQLFEVFYFPIIAYLIFFPTLALVISRRDIDSGFKKYSAIGLTLALLILVVSQPLVIKLKGFSKTIHNEPVNVISTGSIFGNKAPQVHSEDYLLDQFENLINMDQFKGKNLYITFWATWCRPCLQEQPKLEELKAQFADNEEIAFIDISLDKDYDKWASHVKKNNPKGIQLISKNTGKTRANFNIYGTPHHVLVNQDGFFRSIAGPTLLKNDLIINASAIDNFILK